MNKKIKKLAVISILLNILLVGVIIGHMSHHMGPHPKDEKPDHPRMTAIESSKLPEDKKIAVKEMFAQVEEHKVTRKEMEEMREQTLNIISAEVFDEAAYDAQVAKMQSSQDENRKVMSDAIKKLALELNKEERQALAEILRVPPPHDERRGR